MFFLGKVLALITQPLVWVVLVLLAACVALLLRRERSGLRLVALALGLMALTAWQPVSDFLLRQLEETYSEMMPGVDLKTYTGVIVLGGAMEYGYIQDGHHQPLLNSAGERMTETVALLKRAPHLRVLFTGGEGRIRGSGQTEAERAKLFFDALGVPAGQVQYEDRSRNTYENAMLTALLPNVSLNDHWLLLTSASHMPRSMATFIRAGWNVTAYPVDFRTGQRGDWLDFILVRRLCTLGNFPPRTGGHPGLQIDRAPIGLSGRSTGVA